MAHQHFSWLGFALEVRVLSDALIKMLEGVDTGENGQLLLFPIDMQTRQRFDSLATTAEICLKKNTLNTWGSVFEGRNWGGRNLKFLQYEMFEFVQHFPEVAWEDVIAKMRRIAGGEVLEEQLIPPMLEFFGELEGRAIWLNRSRSVRGCF